MEQIGCQRDGQDPVARDATEFSRDSCTTRGGKKTLPSLPLLQNATPLCLPLPQNATPALTDEKNRDKTRAQQAAALPLALPKPEMALVQRRL